MSDSTRETRDWIPRYTVQQKSCSIYFELVADASGAWVAYANHDAIVSRLEDRIAELLAALVARDREVSDE